MADGFSSSCKLRLRPPDAPGLLMIGPLLQEVSTSPMILRTPRILKLKNLLSEPGMVVEESLIVFLSGIEEPTTNRNPC